jgi:hypothetical protein
MNKLSMTLAAILICIVSGITGWFLGHYSRQLGSQSPLEVVVLPGGEEITVNSQEITPSTSDIAKSTEYTGQGVSYARKVEAARFMSPFGVSPGETISKQQPASIGVSTTPGINITPDGVGVTEASSGAFKGGGGSWSWWDTVKQWFHNAWTWIWILGLVGIGVFLILPAIFPAAAPIVAALWTGVKKFFLWLIPIVGGLFTWITGKKETQVQADAMRQTAVALDHAFDQLVAMTSPITGVEAVDLVKTELGKAQDERTKELVDNLQEM